jgi:Peptidase A4 family
MTFLHIFLSEWGAPMIEIYSPNRMRRIAVAVAATAACLVALSVPTARAATPVPTPSAAGYSNNWAGYIANSAAPILGVSTYLKVPTTANCRDSLGKKGPYWGAMWAGIGGNAYDLGLKHHWLEQDGIEAYCAKQSSAPTYYAWWEDVTPSGGGSGEKGFGQKGAFTQVHAGDTIFLQVLPPGQSSSPGEWSFEVWDQTTNADWVKFVKLSAAAATDTGNTAEVITEDPVVPSTSNEEPFVYLGPVKYSGAEYFTAAADGDGLDVNAVTQHRVDMYRSGFLSELTLMVYPTSTTTSPGSDIAGDAFSTQYARHWKTP